MAKWVYKFEEGNASMRNLLGGKGCNLAEMTILGMPIPQGFTVTTEACTDYYNSGKQITEEIQKMVDAYKMEADKIRTAIGEDGLEQMKKDMAVQKAVTVIADAAVEVEKAADAE